MQNVIARFPPSPTGLLHLGSARTALFNYLYAKKFGSKMILRFEDTDKIRSKKEYEEDIFESLRWLGINFSEVFHQSERTLVYKKYLEKMLDEGKAYYSEESKVSIFNQHEEEDEEEEDQSLGSPARVIRLKNSNKLVTFKDEVRGDISIDTTGLGDFVIARSIEEPLYHLAVVIDDFEMGVTHVIRGEDGIYNTPRQILIQEAIGAPRPIYCHIPFVYGDDKTKLSKRHGAISVIEYKKLGYLPEALVNYLALLGWNPGTEQEIFTFDELLGAFDLNKIQRSSASFNLDKLNWMNREHIKKLGDADFKKYVLEYLGEQFTKSPSWSESVLARLLPEIKERIVVFSDIKKLADNDELSYFFEKPKVLDQKSLLPKTSNSNVADLSTIADYLKEIVAMLTPIDEIEFKKDYIKARIWDYASEKGRGNVLWPMRYALSGKDKSPDPFTIAEIIGKA